MDRTLAILATLAFVILFLLAGIYPYRPTGSIGWLLLLFVGIPVWLGLEWIGRQLFSEEKGKNISPKRFSAKRILFALFYALVFIAVASFLLFYLGDSLKSLFMSW